jgi:major membrane immunogen (membrane-anchored lipoprotein)
MEVTEDGTDTCPDSELPKLDIRAQPSNEYAPMEMSDGDEANETDDSDVHDWKALAPIEVADDGISTERRPDLENA